MTGWRRAGATIGALGVMAVAGFVGLVVVRSDARFDVPYPDVEASTDPQVIERGRYLVTGGAHCADCHGDPSQRDAYLRGEDVPLSGGRVIEIPPGRFHIPNLTGDPETGLGKVEAKAIARALRFGVGHDGRSLLPFMEFQNLAEDDVVAIVSYLKTLEPVRNVVPAHEYTTVGKVVKALVLHDPVGPVGTPPPHAPSGVNVENGRYLATHVVHCLGCHTDRSMVTGEVTGPPNGGGHTFEEANGDYISPNITTDPTYGKLAHMDEEAFLARMRAGVAIPGSPMPWARIARMNDDDLRAIYRYLVTIPPAARAPGPVFTPKER